MIFFALALAAALSAPQVSGPGAVSGLHGVVTGAGGRPAGGAYVYVYTGRFPALGSPPDFISGRTGPDGRYVVYLPKGIYVAYARKKADGACYGPLDRDDFSSARPPVVKIGSGMAGEDFRLYRLQKAFSMSTPMIRKLVVVEGAIRDSDGRPAKGLCAVAYEGTAGQAGMPDYISAPSGGDGRYEIFIPAGSRVGLGAAKIGPDGFGIEGWRGRISAGTGNMKGVDIVLGQKGENRK